MGDLFVAYPISSSVVFGLVSFVCWVVAVSICYSEIFDEFWCWLKGSEIIYWLNGGQLNWSRNRGFFLANLNANAIRIIRGPFRRRSVIHGVASSYWQIAGEWERELCGQRISLKSSYGLPVETALKLINTYPSIQAMLDRIDELEKKLEKAEDLRAEWRAANIAVLQLIDTDRQMYRSKSSERIRKWLEAVEQSARSHRESEPPEEKVKAWVRGLPLLVAKSD